MGRSVISEWFGFRSTIGMIPDNLGTWQVPVSVFIVKNLLLRWPSTWTHCLVWSIWDVVLFTMETRNLQSIELHIEQGNEVLKHVSTLCHHLRCLFISECLAHVFVWSLEVGKQQNEYLFRISWNLNQIDWILYLVEISIKNLTFLLNSVRIVSNIHGRWSLLGDYIQLWFLNRLGP